MIANVHTVKIAISWDLIGWLNKIDRFDSSWDSVEQKEGQSLKQIKSIETVRSVGASTRIEGSKMSDEGVDLLLRNIDMTELDDRDSQEVAGYFEVLDLISESYNDIDFTENSLKNLHKILLKYSKKDQWHKGDYKKNSNAVEAFLANGTKQVIFQTTEPGFPTEDAMRNLIEWYESDTSTHPLVKCAVLAYELLSIHPFQDGNGRMSRLISSLLLLKLGYKWIQYVSFEHEVENRKAEYYRELRKCQAERPGEDVTSWVSFFLDALRNIQEQLLQKLTIQGIESGLSPKERSILTYISNYPGCRSGEIAQKLDIPNPTVKRLLNDLLSNNLIEKYGLGPGTNYTIK